MAGRKVFSAGEVLQAADVNDFLMDQSVMVFADSAARGSAIPSPTEGMVTYRSDDDVVEVFDGSSFTPVGPGKILQIVNASIAGATITTTSTSFVTTGLSASITPRDTNSKILAKFNITGDSTSTRALYLTLDRNGTNLGAGVFNAIAQINGVSAGRSLETTYGEILDSPASASSVTYTVEFRSSDGGNVEIRRDLIPGKLILMEVAG